MEPGRSLVEEVSLLRNVFYQRMVRELFCQFAVGCRLAMAQAGAREKWHVKTYLHHSSPSPFFDGLKEAATAYAATVSSSAPPWLMASSRSDFASETPPRNNRVTPRAVSSFVEDREGFANCSV